MVDNSTIIPDKNIKTWYTVIKLKVQQRNLWKKKKPPKKISKNLHKFKPWIYLWQKNLLIYIIFLYQNLKFLWQDTILGVI